jgi:hypothetical protein
LTKYNCNQFYIHVLNPEHVMTLKKNQQYFPIRDNIGVDWNALFYRNQTNTYEFMRSLSILVNDTENHKNSLLEDIFKSHITALS